MQTVSDTKVKLQGNHSVIEMTNSFYSGKDLCKGEFQLLLYSTWVALPIDGCHKGLNLHHPLNHVTVAILVTNAIVKITNHFLQWRMFSYIPLMVGA